MDYDRMKSLVGLGCPYELKLKQLDKDKAALE